MDALPALIARLRLGKLALIAGSMGAASVLAMAPFLLWPVLFATFPALVWTLDGACFHTGDGTALRPAVERMRRAAVVGWSFGFGYFLCGIYWIGYAFMADDSVFHAVSMPFAVAALPAGLALFYGLAAAVAALLWRRGYARLAALAFAFICAEVARGYLFTGFPWNLFGEALGAADALMQAAAYVGVYGLTLFALFIFTSPAAAVCAVHARAGRRAWAPFIISIVALAALAQFGARRLTETTPDFPGARIRIVQPNIPQRERWKPENQRAIFERELALSKYGETGEDISTFTHVIWPEVSIPFLFGFNDEITSPTAEELLAELLPPQTTLILGAERAEGEKLPDGRYRPDRFFNTLFVLGPKARIAERYDKVHLVPFGEYMPFRGVLALAGLGAFSHRIAGFEAGHQPVSRLIYTRGAPPFLPLICYEIIFPGPIGKERPGWIVNITNDAWFGKSTGPHQHLHQARMRAVEEGVPIVRAANTGISAIIDPFGRVSAKLDLGATGVIDTTLPTALPLTFFEKYRLSLIIVIFLFPLQIYLLIASFKNID